MITADLRPAAGRAPFEAPFRAAGPEDDDLGVAPDRQDHLVEVALDENPAQAQVVADEVDAAGDRIGRDLEAQRLP